MELSTLYNIHRYLMIIAFMILLPIGICMPIFKDKVGENWYSYHKHIMFSVLIISFIGICVSLYTKDQEGETNRHPHSTRHGLIGILLFILVVCQMAWAIIVRRYVNDSGSGLTHGVETVENRLTRQQWLIGHRILGSLIVIALLYNGYLGYTIYRDRFLSSA